MKNNTETRPLKTAGILLLIFGLGMPVVSLIITELFLAVSKDDFGKLRVLLSVPVIILPLWLLPVIGGILALLGRARTFVLVTAYISLIYWVPSLILALIIGRSLFDSTSVLFLLYVPLLVIMVPALLNVEKARQDNTMK